MDSLASMIASYRNSWLINQSLEMIFIVILKTMFFYQFHNLKTHMPKT